jgi:uncharacterized protein with PQ loop repeat
MNKLKQKKDEHTRRLTMTEPVESNERSFLNHRFLTVLLIAAGSIWNGFVAMALGMHYAFGSDMWPEEVKHAHSLLDVVTVLALVLSVALIFTICVNKDYKPLWILTISAGLLHLLVAWRYLQVTDKNSATQVSCQLWIFCAIPICLWILASLVRHVKMHRQSETQEEPSTIVEATEEPLLARV